MSMMEGVLEDLSGKVFGRLTVLSFNGRSGSQYLWNCQCECGKTNTPSRSSLVSGKSKSCGCLARERSAASQTKHGKSKDRIYKIYIGMKKRCNNKNSNSFKNYGAKGIKLCNRWEDSFDNFFEDMGAGYKDNLTIDRIDGKKGYSKDNCRWATMQVQNSNKGKTKANKSGVVGVHFCKVRKKWLAKITKNRKVSILGSFDDFNDAVKARREAEKD